MKEWFQALESKLGSYKCTGAEYAFDCPFCSDNKKHLYVNVAKLLFNCFKCHKRGTVNTLLYHLQIRIRAEAQSIERQVFSNIRLPVDIVALSDANPDLYSNEIDYARSRGATGYNSRYFGVREGYVVVFDDPNNIRHYIQRDIYKKQYILPKDADVPVYFLSQAKHYPAVVISEGVFGALAWNLGSRVCGVAIIGKTMSDFQLRRFCVAINARTVVYIALDNDAKTQTMELCAQLKKVYSLYIIPVTQDVDEIKIYSRFELLKSAFPATFSSLTRYRFKKVNT